jgi:hypothetical protein
MASRFLILALILWLSIVNSQLTIVNRLGGLTPPATIDTTDRKSFQEAIRRLTTPELEQRKKNRREFQQRHYAEVLYELTLIDAPGALLASVRSQTQLELQLPSNSLTVTIPVKQPPPPRPGMPGFTGQPSPPMVVPLFEDRRFPADPWSTE